MTDDIDGTPTMTFGEAIFRANVMRTVRDFGRGSGNTFALSRECSVSIHAPHGSRHSPILTVNGELHAELAKKMRSRIGDAALRREHQELAANDVLHGIMWRVPSLRLWEWRYAVDAPLPLPTLE